MCMVSVALASSPAWRRTTTGGGMSNRSSSRHAGPCFCRTCSISRDFRRRKGFGEVPTGARHGWRSPFWGARREPSTPPG
eukprot:10160900-Prorocentrum_lima.AAC.1